MKFRIKRCFRLHLKFVLNVIEIVNLVINSVCIHREHHKKLKTLLLIDYILFVQV